MHTDNRYTVIHQATAAIFELLRAYLTGGAHSIHETPPCDRFLDILQHHPDHPLTLLQNRFHLNSFEVSCLILVLAHHLEPRFDNLVSGTLAETTPKAVTVRSAIELLCPLGQARYAARRVFSSSGKLVRHGLLDVTPSRFDGGDILLSSRIKLRSPALRYILGDGDLCETVAQFARLEVPEVSWDRVVLPQNTLEIVAGLVKNHRDYQRLVSEWKVETTGRNAIGLLLLFSGPPGTGKTLLAKALASLDSRPLLLVNSSDLSQRDNLDSSFRDLFAEASMRDALIVMDECDSLIGKNDPRRTALYAALDDFDGVVVLITNHPDRLDPSAERRITHHVEFDEPDTSAREQLWEVHLPAEIPLGDVIDIETLAARYELTGAKIHNAVHWAVHHSISQCKRTPKLTDDMLNRACEAQLRYALDTLSDRAVPVRRLKDVVLPPDVMKKVEEMLVACRRQTTVMNRWGFGEKLSTGRGIIGLFDGPPGTGKTLCAEILAGELGRPLHRVHLPEVVSKWMGETEKNIRELFRVARASYAVLLFDEADALFSARSSEPKNANDRHANMEVNLLLQELERFPGVCVLTTNHFGALDKAVMRRIQFRVRFDEPDEAERQRIWETLCPKDAPLSEDVRFAVLAQAFELTGGHIKNALLRAAYRAADGPGFLTQSILWEACMDEYQSMGKIFLNPLPNLKAQLS